MVARTNTPPAPAFDKWMRLPSPIIKYVGRSDDKRLAVVINRVTPTDNYMVLAVETTRSAALGGIEAFFADHAHDVLGERHTLKESKALADEYVKKWKTTVTCAPKCTCGEIGSMPKPPTTRHG